ncbi:MAG: hypothetical protein LUG13_03250 [Oscillospiraceae bacterium]|nr:hypothetical protein [Oscillospiraceae bacterium]
MPPEAKGNETMLRKMGIFRIAQNLKHKAYQQKKHGGGTWDTRKTLRTMTMGYILHESYAEWTYAAV